ncbi:MAG TPA: aldo/keto reductase [Thermoanaerobaculia bacterium]|jgi:aryl-alcohol dehydrogenase-like predicted oxidoreductase
MDVRALGKNGPVVSAMGLGCMGMSEFYGTRDDDESILTIHAALDAGVDFLDTADMYGPYTNETLVGKALADRPGRAVLATKFGIVRDAADPAKRGVCGRPEYVRSSCEGSLKRLGVETIDLYTLHRVDPATPIEDTVGAMAGLVQEGKVRWIGLSEASPETLRRASKVHPIAALQSEYSLFTRDVEAAVLPACRELGIGFVAYSPLARGFLSGRYRSLADFPEGDYRRLAPRFAGENFAKNLALVAKVADLARRRKATPAQVALAWVLSRGADVVPIVGTKNRERLEENLNATDLVLRPSDLAELEAAFPPGAAAGERYPAAAMATVGR